ncbi:class I SAM-dependent methyltransferase [Chloroflexota bacterium]
MQNVNRLNYGNWVPRKIIVVFLLIFCVCCALSVVINIGIVRGILIAVSVIFGALFVYMSYAYWLLGKDNGGLQKQLCNTLIDRLEWDGQGKALDIGTGSGRVAIYLAKRYPLAHVVGIDYWGNPWAYSKAICDQNAEIEGVADRVNFQRASAVNLPFADGEYDLVISNFVFHSVRVLNKISLIKDALRVVRKGGVFAFQDLFNKQFYGDIGLFYKELQTWGLKEVRLVDTSDFVYIPVALRLNHMVGNSKILYGIK